MGRTIFTRKGTPLGGQQRHVGYLSLKIKSGIRISVKIRRITFQGNRIAGMLADPLENISLPGSCFDPVGARMTLGMFPAESGVYPPNTMVTSGKTSLTNAMVSCTPGYQYVIIDVMSTRSGGSME